MSLFVVGRFFEAIHPSAQGVRINETTLPWRSVRSFVPVDDSFFFRLYIYQPCHGEYDDPHHQ